MTKKDDSKDEVKVVPTGTKRKFSSRNQVQAGSKVITSTVQYQSSCTPDESVEGDNLEKYNKQKKSKGKLVKRAQPSFKVGDFIFAKVRGYVEWPGYIISIENQHAWVQFFNSEQRGFCTFGKLYDLRESMVFIKKYKAKNIAFLKAVKELAVSLKSAGKNRKIDDFVYKSYIELLM